ncbi:SDR family oxidoreductase [Chryseolinea sp. T2]|uniref:SDR family oxidoreductase n=1 Tax=Chryseolinea sp. T2 TaxID=3129255 RepID=UPI00307842C2
MNLDLTGKRAIVCGSTQGIGKASALELASMGAHVTLIARNEEKLIEIARALDTRAAQRHGYIVADFSDPVSLRERVDRYLIDNPVQILINNTGGPPPGPLLDARPEAFIKAYTEHLVCNQLLAQAVIPVMKREGYGRIINIISTSVKAPLRNMGVSNTTRGAVANWAKTLSFEVAPFNITVNNVLPGATLTQRLESIMEERAGRVGKTFQEVKALTAAEVPAGRIGTAEEVAAAVAFLASPAASYINGINIPVDGGRTGNL